MCSVLTRPTGRGDRSLARRRDLAKSPAQCYVYPNWIYAKWPVTRSTVFTSNRSQAVRLPKAVAFPESVHQVEIIKVGHGRLIVPVGTRWDDLFLNGPHASSDFMRERVEPAAEEREPL